MSLTLEEFHMTIFDFIEAGNLTGLKEALRQADNNVNLVLNDVYVMNGTCTRKPTLLIVATGLSQLPIMTYLLEKNANPDIPDKRLRCPIHFAAMKEDENALELLIKHKADVNKKDWDDCSPLHYCAASGFMKGALHLLDAGAQIDIQTRTKETPLVIALEGVQPEMVSLFLQMHCNIEKPSLQKRTPLFFAASGELTQMLLDGGAKVDEVDEDGNTPLHFAASRNLYDVCSVLIKFGAKIDPIDNQKQTPLHVAAEEGHAEIAQLLLENGASLKCLDVARRTPEMLARRNERYNVLEIISKFHNPEEDDDAPLLVFRPFAGVLHAKNEEKDFYGNSFITTEIPFNFDIKPQ